MGADAVEAGKRVRKMREFSEAEKQEAAQALQSFNVSYEEVGGGVTLLTISGSAQIQVVEQTGPTGPIYTSAFVQAPQDDFLQALEYTGRNLMTNAIKREFVRQNPNQAPTRAKNNVIAQENAVLKAHIATLFERFGVDSFEALQDAIQAQKAPAKKSA